MQIGWLVVVCIVSLSGGCRGATPADSGGTPPSIGATAVAKASGREAVAGEGASTLELVFKSQFAPYFQVGAALSERQILGKEEGTLQVVARHFNQATPENVMKFESVHPAEGTYTWKSADALVAFCERHKMKVVGHTLIWHQQTPEWVFQGPDGREVTRARLIERMQQHIRAVVGRYRGRVSSWDVVNEALNDDGTLRDSNWRRIIGDDYIELAFEAARAADPGAELWYNDYSLFKPEKRKGALAIVRRLAASGVRVDGVGIQGHYALGYPEDLAALEASIVEFSKVGKVAISELDVSVLPFPEGQVDADVTRDVAFNARFDPYTDGLPEEVQRKQEAHYAELFKLFIRHHDKIARVTFWGVHDGQTWRNDWPMKGRTDYPLLFDRRLQLKEAATALFRLGSVRSAP